MHIKKRLMADRKKTALSGFNNHENEDKRKIFCGNLSEKITSAILFELFLQAGPVESVEIPKPKDGHVRNYAFITYVHVSSVPYALQLFANVKLHNRKLLLKNRTPTSCVTNLRANKTIDSLVCDKSNGRSEKWHLRNQMRGPQRSQSLQCPSKDQFTQKPDNFKDKLPRIPLRVSNKCGIPNQIPSNLNGGLCREYMSTNAKETMGVPTSQQTENFNNLPPTPNLTSQFLNNYIYLMQKIVPQRLRFQ